MIFLWIQLRTSSFTLFYLIWWSGIRFDSEARNLSTEDAMTQCNDDGFTRNKNSSYTYDDCRYIRHKTRKTHHSHKMCCCGCDSLSTTKTIYYAYILHKIADFEDYFIKLFYCRFSSLSHCVSLHRTHQQLKQTLYIHVFPPILTLLTFDYINCLLCCDSPVLFFTNLLFRSFVFSFFLFIYLDFLAFAQHKQHASFFISSNFLDLL